MKTKLSLLILATGFFPLCGNAIITSNNVLAETDPYELTGLNWDYVYNYKRSSSVAVGDHWLLTASHVADDYRDGSLIINETLYTPLKTVYHESADLALVQFDQEFPGHYDIYTDSMIQGQEVIMVGYGNTGTVSEAYFFDSNSGDGTKRWGSIPYYNTFLTGANIIEGNYTNYVSSRKMYLIFQHDNFEDTFNEAGAGVYDSGGPSFTYSDDTWQLAGINVSRSGNNNTGFKTSFSIQLADYAGWIDEIINAPDPDGDLDMDGIPNGWEAQYGTPTGLVASADNDNDGYSNLEEYIADTNPTNASDVLNISGISTGTNQVVSFTGRVDRAYRLLYTTNNLADSNLIWQTTDTNWIAGNGIHSSISTTNSEPKTFYRLEAAVPTNPATRVLAFDDFSEGTPGHPIIYEMDQKKYGLWLIGGNNALKGAYYGSGGYAVSPTNQNGGAILQGAFSHTAVGADSIRVSLDLTPREHANLNQGMITIGLYETIDSSKGLLFNNQQDDMLAFRYQFQNAANTNNEGKATWKIYDDGAKVSTSWFGPDAFENGSDKVIHLELTYTFTTGDAVANIYYDGTLISSSTKSAPGLDGFSCAGFGWSGLDNGWSTDDPSQVTCFKVETLLD